MNEQALSKIKYDDKRMQAVNQAVNHWRKMIEWVKQQNPNDIASHSTMYVALAEDWFGDHCALCELYHFRDEEGECDNCFRGQGDGCEDPDQVCPLCIIDENCNHKQSLWQRIREAKSWGSWLFEAERMLDTLCKIQHQVEK